MSLGQFPIAHRRVVMSLYKRALKQSLDWIVQRDIWRQEALAIRSRFEANKDVTNPRRIQAILNEAEKELLENRHCDPCIYPSQVDGTKFQRNTPPPISPPVHLDV